MSRLRPEAEKLVQAGRTALRPTDADRERVLAALLPKIGGVPAPETASAPSLAPVAAKTGLVKAGAVLIGLGVGGAAVFFLSRPEPPPAPAPVVLPAPPAARAPVPPREEPKTAVVTPAPSVVEKRAPVGTRSSDGLAREVEILSRAGAELHAGRPQAALAALDEHQRKFPRGVLTQERTAARIQALCALGRLAEARAALARLSRTAPNSPHEARARKACGATLAENK